jgi:hypothetical protein
MKTGTKVALFLGGLVLVGVGLGVFVHYRNKKKTKAAEKRLEEANENYIPETLGTVTAMEAGMNLASSSSTRPTELAGVKK